MLDVGELPREELVELVTAQRARIQAQEQRIGDQDQQIQAQQRQLEELAAELARPKRLVSRNSGNSSTPPSKDDELGRKPPTTPRGRRSGRRPGKQQGSGGSALAWDADPAVVVDHHPEGNCSGCGADLAGALDEGTVRSCQVTDIPLVTATTLDGVLGIGGLLVRRDIDIALSVGTYFRLSPPSARDLVREVTAV